MTVLAIGIAVLYLPMLVMIGYSFNSSPLVGVWGGFSTHWYSALAGNDQLKSAAWLSLRVGFVAATAAMVLGTMAAGYVVSPLNLLAQDAHLEFTLAHSETRFVFAAPEFVDRIGRLLGASTRKVTVRATDPDALGLDGGHSNTLAGIDSSTPALLMYTSGTTGLPKGALLSHGNLVHAAGAVVDAHALTAADRVLSSLPLYHVNGQCIATVSPVFAGGSIVLPHRFSVSQWWPLVERYRPTWLNMVPTIISYLLNGPDLTPAQAEACRGIRFGRSASSPLPPEHHKAFEQRFGVSVIEAMGLTECASVAFANPLDPARRKYGTPGLPLGLEARVVAPDARALAQGASGEIQLRGANVMLGYWNQPEETAKAMRGDWLLIGCERSLQFHRHFYGDEPERVDLCPRNRSLGSGLVLTKCCLMERGLEIDGDTAVVPWGANLDEVREGLRKLLL